ncbi:hypothetical protein pqer_cds_489 [Pandoravirus quercus]|uniref:Uncharacterized protein n=2 Tax=Pandoravirus TaxID=2060084 RepID=A0A2U7U8Z1_9VIRU|nr:hypothetical protein pqer_cds_489 [Pandoravirus quercus]AVK74911.1 hypothetical protein pqer_cds_489 [Pandoravirus quercus]QBZ81097.1 hypothetical protein pclt_cds_503 [Pandoravirus celtis]
MAHRCRDGSPDRFTPTDYCMSKKSPTADDTTFSALVSEAARWRQMALVDETPALLHRAREAREATMPTWNRGGDGDGAKVDPVRLVVSMAFGFAHHRPDDD